MSERITPIWEDLVNELLCVEDITEQLKLTGTLSQNDVEDILHKHNTCAQSNRKLLMVILRKHAYDIFCRCLHVSGQGELYQLMVSTGPVQPVTDELTTLAYRVFCKHGIGEPRKLQVPPHLQQRLDDLRDTHTLPAHLARIVDLLKEEQCFSSEEGERILSLPNSKAQVNTLVDCLRDSSLYYLLVLAMYLDLSQQKNLLKQISEHDILQKLDQMDKLLLIVYYHLLGSIALRECELETRLGVAARDFVSLVMNRNKKPPNRTGLNETYVEDEGEESVELMDTFSRQDDNKPTRTVLLIGAPGTGKSTAVMQLAREISAKKIQDVSRAPFVIQLRSVDWSRKTSLKDFLFRYGPELKEEEMGGVWKALSANDSDLCVILDGADEGPAGFLHLRPGPVPGTEHQASPEDLVNHLLLGDLLPGARVLLTSRPFGLQQCWRHFDKKIEVVGFGEESLERFLRNELVEEQFAMVREFLSVRCDVRSLLYTPLHAASFVLHARTVELNGNLLLQSRTQLALSLILSLVKTECRKTVDTIPAKMLKNKGGLLNKMCKLVAKMLREGGSIKIEMTEDDLEEADIDGDDCVASGLFSEKTVAVDGDVFERVFLVPHQSLLEAMAAIGLEQEDALYLVDVNCGRHDLVLTYVAGILGSERSRRMLKYVLHKDALNKDYTELGRRLVDAVLRSKRRCLHGGVEFCLRVVRESQQWELVNDLKQVIGTKWLTLDNPEDLSAAASLVGPPDALVYIQVKGVENGKHYPGVTSVLPRRKTATKIAGEIEHLRGVTSVCLWNGGVTRASLPSLCDVMSKLTHLEGVYMRYNYIGSAPDEAASPLCCLSAIENIRYIHISRCGLTQSDVNSLTSACWGRLRHLDVCDSWPSIRRGSVRSMTSLDGLSVDLCNLTGEEVERMVFGSGSSLLFLNASGNRLSVTSCSRLLTHCSELRELYVDDDVLVMALLERHVTCKLNHLFLFNCTLSSSSSTSSSLMEAESESSSSTSSASISDVLTRHPSFVYVTLRWCSGLYCPRVITDLASSMTRVTSLYLSPCDDHPFLSASLIASLITSTQLTQLWLDDVDKWSVADFIHVILAVNVTPSLATVALTVHHLSPLDLLDVIRALDRPLTRIWLAVDKQVEEYAEVVREEGRLACKAGMIQLVSRLYTTYIEESGVCYQHLPPSLPHQFRPRIFMR